MVVEVAKDGERAEGQEEVEGDEISLGSVDTDSEKNEDGVIDKFGNEVGDSERETDNEEETNDFDVETVQEFNKLRAHFKWDRDRAKKRQISYQPPDVDRKGIPKGKG